MLRNTGKGIPCVRSIVDGIPTAGKGKVLFADLLTAPSRKYSGLFLLASLGQFQEAVACRDHSLPLNEKPPPPERRKAAS